MKPQPLLLLGEAPNEATVGRPELWLRPDDSGIQHSANRLLKHTGYTLREYLRLFARDNLLHELPPRGGKGRQFPAKLAKEQAPRVHAAALKHEGTLLLGRRVASAFQWCLMVESEGLRRPGPLVRASKVPYLQWHMAFSELNQKEFWAVIVPHPSGINTWWNDPDNRALARDFFDTLKGYQPC